MSNNDYLLEITKSVKARFQEARTILSFSEYLELLHDDAEHFCRHSAQYLRDAFNYFGTTSITTQTSSHTHYKLFDQEHNEEHWVVGQEEVQESIMGMLNNFIEEGHINKLVVLHGPNGSGKSSIARSMSRALEKYSYTQEGALYRFNWIFPSEKKITRSGIGFSTTNEEQEKLISYAHLEGDQINARLSCPLKDHPLLLLPLHERESFFDKLYKTNKLSTSFKLGEYLKKGNLSPRNKKIFNTLLLHYAGNYADVLRHIQVERYYISRRYRESIVTIEPQMHVDASIRQVTADHSFSALPKSLSSLNLFEPKGALVDANRGLIEYSDLLKRPFEAYKYLLSTCETGHITVDSVMLFLDLIMIGSVNDQNLDQFREIPEFLSFKSRIELVRVPYLLRYSVEQQIYDSQLISTNITKPITPHVTMLASLWAILTRLKRPNHDRLPPEIADLVTTFTPLEKAYLYDNASIPSRFSAEEKKKILKAFKDIYNESQNDTHYEGRIGASPREIRSLLLNSAQNNKYKTLSPLALFDEMEVFIQNQSVYQFLQLEPRNDYYDPERFIDVIREVHLEIIREEFHIATGLIKPNQHNQLLTRYIQNIKAFIQKETIRNPITGESEEPDKKLMDSVESVLLSDDETIEEFRQNLISKIAATKIDHPSAKLDIPNLFADYIKILKTNFFAQHQKRLQKIAQHCLIHLVDEKHLFDENELKIAKETIDYLEKSYGYTRDAIQELLALIVSSHHNSTQKADIFTETDSSDTIERFE